MQEAYDGGTLIASMCNAMEPYDGHGDPDYLAAMARQIKNGLPTWEHILIRPGEPWTPDVTPKARRASRQSIADATAYIPFI